MRINEKLKLAEQTRKTNDLLRMRNIIDHLDREIMQLIDQRMEFALRINRLKGKISAPEKELLVLEKIKKMPLRLLSNKFTQKIIREIINESKKIQRGNFKLIGFQGERGAYSEAAAFIFNPRLVTIPCPEFEDIFEAVTQGVFDYGVVPVENSTDGQVTAVSDLFITTELKIVAEISLPIHHCLLALLDAKINQIKTVYSHPQALAQCRQFLRQKGLEAKAFYDTAGAARMISEKKIREAGVIASKRCAEIYGLKVLKENIEDYPLNQTRFLIISKTSPGKGEKCSLVFSIKHEAGSLSQVLKVFSEKGINLTRIESRPDKRHPGEYFFLIDFEGASNNKKVKAALNEIRPKTIFYKFLGGYRMLTN